MNFKIVNCYCYSGLPGGSVVITNKAVNFNIEEQHEIVSLKKLFAIYVWVNLGQSLCL